MSAELDNIDELEALLAELDELDEPVKPAAAAVKAESEELSDDDLAELAELEAAKSVDTRIDELESMNEVEPEPAPEPAPITEDEIEGLDAVLAEVEAVEAKAVTPPITSSVTEAVRKRRVKPGETVNPVEAATKSKAAALPVFEEADEEPGHMDPSLKTFIDPDLLQSDLEVSETNLSKAMIRQAPLFARYSALAAKAQFQADRADQQVDLVEAELDSDIRDDMNAKGIKITENLVKAAIIRHPKYQKAVTRYNEAKAIAEMVKTAADSFRHRRDMLIQMGADRREEMKGAVRVQEHPGASALRTINGEK